MATEPETITLSRENMEAIAERMQYILGDTVFTYTQWRKDLYNQANPKHWVDKGRDCYLTRGITTTIHKIWIQDQYGTLHLEPGLSITFDADERGFTIEEPWRPERATYRYQYHVNDEG